MSQELDCSSLVLKTAPPHRLSFKRDSQRPSLSFSVFPSLAESKNRPTGEKAGLATGSLVVEMNTRSRDSQLERDHSLFCR
jgi:hypothetical protein